MNKLRFNLLSGIEAGSRTWRATLTRRLALALILASVTAGWAQGGMPPIPSAPNALTLQQAVEQAKAKNPTLLSAQQNLLSVKAQEIQAGVRQNPYLAVEGSNVSIPTSS